MISMLLEIFLVDMESHPYISKFIKYR